MPAGEAFAAAVADSGASDVNEALTVRQAALTLAPLVRAEREAALAALDATELGLITALREQKVAWARIGEALGTTRQGAAQRAERLAARTT
jgi:predicted glycosyltransferase